MGCFYGIEGIEFVWHGEWADPEIEYRAKRFNYWDVEDALYGYYKEDCEEAGTEPQDRNFPAWLHAHPQEAYSMLDDWIAVEEDGSL